KNGLVSGEAVVFLEPRFAENFKFRRKQAMQLSSKMRYVSAQFEAYLEGELWLKNARHANAMAQLLARDVSSVPGVTITQPVQANGVFARVPAQVIPKLLESYFFYVWDDRGAGGKADGTKEVRWMCSFDTQMEDIQTFVDVLRGLLTES
ncbi:MAG TPA: threonine aldolase, partial [Bdellovibrionota bacterium]|nr:threonine aldolase [Bdellovibrionota bacterium]